jgi:hypothetical protein
LENVICKVFRFAKNPALDQLFTDILVPLQDLFIFHGDSVTVLSENTDDIQLLEGPGLIHRWLLGGQHLTMSETVVALSIPSQMPTKLALSAMKVPKQLFRVPFEDNPEMVLNDNILMEPNSDLTSVFNKV